MILPQILPPKIATAPAGNFFPLAVLGFGFTVSIFK
jgi:hypothetical protein